MKTLLHKSLSLLLTLVLALSLTVPALAVEVPVTGITLDQTSVTLTPGGKVTLKAAVKPENATNQTILWSSNQESVATVSNTGEITAVAEGTAAITAQTEDGKWPAICTVTVEKDYVTGVTITPAGPESLPVGTSRQLSAAVTYAHNTGAQGVTWSSTDPTVATVSSTGLVTAVKEGTAAITAQTKDADQKGGTLSAIYQVTVTKSDPNASKDAISLSAVSVTGQGGLFQAKTLKAPAVTIKNGDADVTANYTIGYS